MQSLQTFTERIIIRMPAICLALSFVALVYVPQEQPYLGEIVQTRLGPAGVASELESTCFMGAHLHNPSLAHLIFRSLTSDHCDVPQSATAGLDRSVAYTRRENLKLPGKDEFKAGLKEPHFISPSNRLYPSWLPILGSRFLSDSEKEGQIYYGTTPE